MGLRGHHSAFFLQNWFQTLSHSIKGQEQYYSVFLVRMFEWPTLGEWLRQHVKKIRILAWYLLKIDYVKENNSHQQAGSTVTMELQGDF